MTLSEYKHSEGLTLNALAAQLGHPVSTVHGWLHGKRLPEPDLLAVITERTEGKVGAADLRPDLAKLFVGTAPLSVEAAAA